MRQNIIFRMLYGLLAGLVLCVFSAPSSGEVLKIVVKDTIHPITDEYIGRALDEAAAIKTRQC